MNSIGFTSKIHLVISVLIVFPIAFIYGFNLESLVDIKPETIDERNFSKSIMTLYLGFVFVWVLGLFKSRFLKIALVTNMVFMLALAFGRLLSVILDGTPSAAYIVGMFGEFILGFYGLWVLKNSKESNKANR